MVAINSQLLKIPLLVITQEKSRKCEVQVLGTISNEPTRVAVLFSSVLLPVGEADGRVHDEESQELFIQQPVNAALPGQEQLGKAAETSVGDSGGVGDGHW